MIQSEYPVLAREGRVHMITSVILGLLSTWWLGYWSIPVWLLVVFVFQFFRDPKRKITTTPGAIVAPASGKVVSVGEEPNPYNNDQTAMKISIFMNVFSVHSNLVPVAGTINNCQYYPGKFLNAAVDKSSTENERNAIEIETSDGHQIHCVQIAGLIARRILSYVREGDKVETGQRYGFIRFGSRVDLYIPTNSKLSVRLGQWVSSGNNTLAYLPGY